MKLILGGAQDGSGIPRKKKGIDKLLAGLQGLRLEVLNITISDHELDSVRCVYVGKTLFRKKAIIYGDPN